MDRTTLPPTHLLTERVPLVCRLSSSDVEYLLAHHRAALRLAPTGQPDHYQLIPTGHVGAIVAPDCRLLIRPKIPIANLFYMLDPTGSVPVAEDQTETETGTNILDFLAARLAQLLSERARAGLHRAYEERAESGPYLHGRLDLSAQLRESFGRKEQFHCQFEEFTLDVPCNQVPKATAERVLRSPLIGDGVRIALVRAMAPFSAIQPIELNSDSFQRAVPDRLNQSYGPLLDLCRLLAEGLEPTESAGRMPCPSFLLNMERVFEQYVTTGVLRAFADQPVAGVLVQPLYTANRPEPGQPDILMRPDIAIGSDDPTNTLVDAKWKRWKKSSPLMDDYCQVIAYCTALGGKRGILVYPGRQDRVWKYQLTGSPIKIEVRTLRVTGSKEECTRSLQRFGLAIRKGLTSKRARS